MRSLAVGCMAWAALAGSALAQGASDEVIVTATRLSGPPLASESRIDAAAIDAQRAGDGLDLLRNVTGVSVSQPAGGVAEVFLRGAESNFTVVLVDGVRANDTSNARGGGYDFSTLSPDEIERVAVVRGPLSAVHGSDAMAGAIAVTTRRPAASPTLRLGGEAGSDGYARGFASISGPVSAALRAGVKAAHLDSGTSVEGASQELTSAQVDLDFDGARTITRTGLRYAERARTGFPDGSGGPLFAVLRDLERAEAQELSAWTQARHSAQDWELHASASVFAREEAISTPAIAPGVFSGAPAAESDTRFRRIQLGAGAVRDVSQRMEIGAGVDLQHETGERDGVLDLGFALAPSVFDLERFTAAAYAEARADLAEGWRAYGAARIDAPDEGEARGSGRLALSYEPPRWDARLRASWASGHKLPSFYALGDALVGNPDLRPETSETYELAAEKTFADGRASASVTGFWSRYEDIIDFDFVTFRLVNRSEAAIEGVELRAAVQASETLSVAGFATFSDISLDGVDAGLLNRSESYGGAQIVWRPTPDWTLQASARHVGERRASSTPTGDVVLESYETLDISASRRLNGGAVIYAAADNVLDETLQEAAGFPAPGFRLRVGVSLALGLFGEAGAM